MCKLKLILPVFMCIGITSANATDMCIKDDALMVVLDTQINGTALANNATGKTWSTRFPYGIVSGIGGCYSNVGATQGMVATDQTNISAYSSGTYCYCKMLRPIESAWVYSGSLNFNNDCATNCASYCASHAASAVALRRGLFGSVGI